MSEWIRVDIYSDTLTQDELQDRIAEMLSYDRDIDWESIDGGYIKPIDVPHYYKKAEDND